MTTSGTNKPSAVSLVDFLERFVASSQFQRVFEEGMRLVEEAADYLDGPGRETARNLSRDAAVVYATESMRLTTRLMQMASWLLLQRAVAAGELSEQDARREQENINLPALAQQPDERVISCLPEELAALMGRSQRLYERIVRLDEMIQARNAGTASSSHPLAGMLDRLEAEFSRQRVGKSGSENSGTDAE